MIEKLCMVLIFVGVAVGVGIYADDTPEASTGSSWAAATLGAVVERVRVRHQLLLRRHLRGLRRSVRLEIRRGRHVDRPIGNAILEAAGLVVCWAAHAQMTHRLGASTMPEFFGARFSSPKGLRIAAAAIIFSCSSSP